MQNEQISDSPISPMLAIGTRVYVCDRYLGNWTGGFEIAEVVEGGYRLRRLSDDRVFPDVFPDDSVRRERRKDLWRGNGQSPLDSRRFP